MHMSQSLPIWMHVLPVCMCTPLLPLPQEGPKGVGSPPLPVHPERGVHTVKQGGGGTYHSTTQKRGVQTLCLHPLILLHPPPPATLPICKGLEKGTWGQIGGCKGEVGRGGRGVVEVRGRSSPCHVTTWIHTFSADFMHSFVLFSSHLSLYYLLQKIKYKKGEIKIGI